MNDFQGAATEHTPDASFDLEPAYEVTRFPGAGLLLFGLACLVWVCLPAVALIAWRAALMTATNRGAIRLGNGSPLWMRFAVHMRITETGCWVWTGKRDKAGYPRMGVGRRTDALAHRVSYEEFVGPIPEGMTVDHLCFVPLCVNPAHLRLLTHLENSRNQRSADPSHCVNGHAYDEPNTYRASNGTKFCRACGRKRAAEYRLRRAAS